MWKKGELVWVRLNPSDSWIPGRILDPSEPLGFFVSFFDLMKPRYVPKPCIRSFERNFGTLVADSWRYRHFVNSALQTHFWNISFGLWCSCQPPIDSTYLDREIPLPCSPLSSDSALGFVREIAVSQRVPLRRLAETNSSTAQILSFKRYTLDFERSESVYEEVRESAKLMDRVADPDWYLDPSYKMDCIDDMVSMFPETEDADLDESSDLSLRDPLPKDIHCCSVDKLAQSWNTRSHVISSNSSFVKACGTMARTSNLEEVVNFETDIQGEEHNSAVEELEDRNDRVEEENKNEKDVEDKKGHSETSDKEDETSKREEVVEIDSRNSTLVGEENLNCIVRKCCQVEHSSCLLNSEFPVEDIIEEDTTVAAQREATPDVMIETHSDIICSDDKTVTSAKQLSPLLDASNGKAFLAKPVSFVVLEACKNLVCSVEETSANPRSKLDVSANTLDEDRSDRNNFNETRENCPEDALESHIVDVGQVSLHITPVEQLQDLEVATAVKDKTSAVDNISSIGVKRKASGDKASGNSKRRKKASQQSISADKPQNLQLLKDKRFADPKCLRMKFLSAHVNLPSKSELLKRFSVFGKIDASRTDVNPGQSSAKVVFLQSIDAVTAYQFARSKKFKLGRSKVMYRLDAFEGDSEANKVSLSQKPQKSVPSPRSCLKKHGSVDKEEGRSHLKVKFQTATNS
ncbi:hypothetical protein N665_0152s0012 [Sinapis alba]|nr:hypothetical protein N665_0152s0012 [Sinapis alba]